MSLQRRMADAIRSYVARSNGGNPQIRNLLQYQLLYMMLVRIVLYTLVMLAGYLLEQSQFALFVVPKEVVFSFVVVIYFVSISSAFYLLLYPQQAEPFGFVQLFLDTVFVTILVFFTGTSNSQCATVYFFPIIVGGLLLPLRGGLVAAALSTLLYGGLLLLEQQTMPPWIAELHLFAPVRSGNSLNLFAVHGLIFFLGGLLSIFFGVRLRRTESALSLSRKQLDHLSEVYKRIFDNISTGLFTIDSKRVITSANKALCRITTRTTGELLGHDVLSIFPGLRIVPDSERITADYLTPQGELRRLGYSCMHISGDENLSREEDYASMIVAMRDITDVENLERQVRQAEKLAAIGTMSASIAHEFRNPITAISGSAQLLAADFAENNLADSSSAALTGIIMRESERLSSTIGEFLKFARPEKLNPEFFQLTTCLDEVFEMLRAGGVLPPGVNVITRFDDALALWGDERQMHTVFDHLIQNAINFCPKGGEKISLTADESVVKRRGVEESVVRIAIGDNGPGIEEELLPQIFDPFYTTRADGTGLGLAIVNQIITEHRGRIVADNGGVKNEQGGRGARFRILLPLGEQAEETPEPRRAPGEEL